ncbi:MAG TPA: SAM-dependent methyltransferase [Nitrospirae bacterium]|nr:SAM-dependent methyltransferase [Nitrospirota bacterium]
MAFTLDKVVLWGRSFEEYVLMFSLSEEDLKKRILGCGDGPASFNSVLAKRGGKVISIDPIYKFSNSEIRQRIDETYEEVLDQIKKNMQEFVWNHIGSVEEVGRARMKAMGEFLSDYPIGLKEGRYIEASLPVLPFQDKEFDIALCSHLLFLYSEQLSEDFHIDSIRELCRVAEEVRIFPLLELGSRKSRHLGSVLNECKDYSVEILPVEYEFQKAGNKMLRVKSDKDTQPC